ncbi:MAG TPA: tetratricopeptide repeat protein [Thermoanaerobaculia bacterium]|nr:tetratricopeptide repeat protein [Thermoanaerobaculia bacterium]
MGEVYAARDPQLGRRVAIKKLPLRLTGDRDTLARFTHEARSASALNHPNIVTIHEVGADEGVPYIVMEYIDGTDLRTLINEGPLPIRKVLDIAAQIADGLAAAHERGIVHRDLKPENIMLTRDGFVKVLDFGLAKMVATSADAENTLELDLPGTNPGTILGTVGYMSPEQAMGKRLDFRSDQFALGAIIHELVSSKPAFEAENAIDTLSAILHHVPAPVGHFNSRAPVQLSDIVQRLLDKSPEGRYVSTRDLAREIRLLRDRVVAEESGYHSSAEKVAAPRPRATPAIVAAIALALFLVGVFIVTGRREPSSPQQTAAVAAPKKYLAVLRFQDLSGEPNGQLVVDGFAETLTARLAHFPTVQVMRPQTAAPEPTTTDPRKFARDLGANLVLTGSMMRAGDRIRVTYTVVETQPNGREWRDLVEGNVADLFAVQDDVAESVARNLDLGATPARPPLDPAVSQRRYLEALGHLRRYDSEQSLDSAIGILKGLGESPSVQAVLARGYLYKFQITREPELAAAANTAAESALQADPQSIDVNITLGELRRRTGRYKEAVDAFVRVLSQHPNNADAVLGLAETHKAAGDVANAEQAYRRAIGLQPNSWSAYNKLGAFYFNQGRFSASIPLFQKVVTLVPDNERGYNNLGGAYQRLGRYEEAVHVFSQSIARAPSGQGYTNLGTSYYFAGRYREAADAFEKAIELTPHKFLYWRNLGDAYRWIPGQEVSARRAYERAIALCDEAIRLNPKEARAYMSRASALAKLGRTREARTAILHALELEPQYAANAYEAAVVANIAGSEEDATARIEQALRLGYHADHILRDPEFANLRKSGRLQAIIAGFRSKTSPR